PSSPQRSARAERRSMNSYEWITLAVTGLTVGAYLVWRFRRWRDTLALLVACALPLYLALDHASRALTTDELGITAALCDTVVPGSMLPQQKVPRAQILDFHWR